MIADWLLLECQPSTEEVNAAYTKLFGVDPGALDALFEEVGILHETLNRLSNTDFVEKNVDEKWTVIFRNNNLIYLKKLVSALFSMFPSNAYCESVFSVAKNIKTDERNRMETLLLNSLVSIKLNPDFDCNAAYNLFLSHSDLLEQVKGQGKYKYK